MHESPFPKAKRPSYHVLAFLFLKFGLGLNLGPPLGKRAHAYLCFVVCHLWRNFGEGRRTCSGHQCGPPEGVGPPDGQGIGRGGCQVGQDEWMHFKFQLLQVAPDGGYHEAIHHNDLCYGTTKSATQPCSTKGQRKPR